MGDAAGPDSDMAEHLLALVDRLHLDFETAVAGFELSSSQAKALRFLAEAGPVPMRDLARCLRCDASNVTGLVDRLELRGLVERRTSHGDRRVKTLVVTDAGAEIASRMWTQVVTGMVSMAGLGEQEQHALVDLLRRLGQEPAARCWVTRPAAD
ncbi:MAG: MarR family transcriptional regulator [Acidimicrobiales bacterium]